MGEKYQPTSGKELAAETLEHGRKQVEKMLKDRPAMSQYGEETAMLRRWAARKFAGEDMGSLVDWDPASPLHSDAEHVAPDGKLHGAILIEPQYTEGPKQGQERSFEELWAGAVFELHNINNAKEFVRLRKEAEQGRISKENYVAAILKPEMRAAQQTRAFYAQVFLPFAARKKLPTEPGLWFTLWWVRPEDALKQFTDKTAYPWRPYAGITTGPRWSVIVESESLRRQSSFSARCARNRKACPTTPRSTSGWAAAGCNWASTPRR